MRTSTMSSTDSSLPETSTEMDWDAVPALHDGPTITQW